MGQTVDILKALEDEFACYYHGDELPPVHSEAFHDSLLQRASASASRLRRAIGDDNVNHLISVLESLKRNSRDDLLSSITEATLLGWADDPQTWAVFQHLIDQFVASLRQQMHTTIS